MSEDWPDISGVTERGGHPCLPADPEVVARTLAIALEGGTLAQVTERALRGTRLDASRIAGLVGWLPLSRVVWLRPEDGELRFVPGTDLADLSLRFAAWAGAQPVGRADTEALLQLAQSVMSAGVRLGARKPTHEALMPPHEPSLARAADAPGAGTPLTARLRLALDALDASFLERKGQVRAALLTLLARQHLLLLGPPGTAKSMLARALCEVFEDANYFEYLLSRFTHPDEIFGPVSIPGLKNEDYRRITEGFLPTAHIAFLDEVFKANSAILNSLLTLVNERIFHHGRHRDPAPLIGLVGASNELPEPGAGLDALYDRFLVRLSVPPLGEAAHFLAVATGELPRPAVPASAKLSRADLDQLREAASAVAIPAALEDELVALWQTAARADWGVSDRRWRAAVHLLRVAAASEGRTQLETLDLLLLEPILAPSPEHAGTVREALLGRLGQATLPQHDLRVQWTLLRGDRVAPPPGQPVVPPLAPSADWRERLVRRHQSITDLIHHLHAAVSALAADRARVEQQTAGRLWLERVPPSLLSAHISASRDLAAILESAERYARWVQSPAEAVKALLRQVPVTRRVYGAGAVLVLEITDASVVMPLSLAGEKVAANLTDTPRVRVTAEQLLDAVAKPSQLKESLAGLPPAAARDAMGALEGMLRNFDGDAVPQPPELPAP